MTKMIYNPLEEYEKNLSQAHLENTKAFFDDLAESSRVNIEENRKTVAEYDKYKEKLGGLKKRLTRLRILRVFMCISLVLIPFVVLKLTPKIRALREEIEKADEAAEKLLKTAYGQMSALNGLFSDGDALNIVQKTLPQMSFDECFSAEKENDMRINFDFLAEGGNAETTLDLLSGEYNQNPFLFESKRIHTMGTEIYRGEKVITWTESYTDEKGNRRTRRKSQTLHASVTKPKPFYKTQVVLNYGAQCAPDLCFSRDATGLDKKSEKGVERYIKHGEKRLKKKTDKALKNNDDFTSMANTDFEVLFDALDRTDEVQFRELFTPLAQTNMVDLILSKSGYGDDFNFFKNKRMNKIISNHSKGRSLKISADDYRSYSFDAAKERFVGKNTEFFKAVYFDFAPLWAIPAYQESPVQSLKPINIPDRLYALKEYEALANVAEPKYIVHPDTKTSAILKSKYVATKDGVDETLITAYSYNTKDRVDMISVLGGDGRYHEVPVHWVEYLPLEQSNSFFVTKQENKKNINMLAAEDGLCMFKN